MPKKNIDYSKTVIYKFVCNDFDVKDLYIGNTTNFTKRKSTHKDCTNNVKAKGYNHKVYQIMRENGGWDNWSMIEVEKYPCLDQNEATKRERFYAELLKATMNTYCPNRKQKEYNEDNKEKVAEYKKKHYDDNKEKILERTHKWHQDNKEKIHAKKKVYYENNIDAIKEKSNKPCVCECGCNYTFANKSRHMKSKIHIANMEKY